MAYLSLQNLSKRFGPTLAVRDFNLEVERGEFVSFLGPSGCGKTTTLRMIAGFELPTSGKIILDGNDITTLPPNRRHIGMVFQSYALFPNLTVADNIAFGLKVAKRPPEEIRKTISEMLDLIRLTGFENRYPYQLSGGQQQRVALARALAIRPRVLLLDEPLSALDAKIRVELRAEIRRIQQTLGITAIYVTHDQEEALSLSDRVVVMYEGRIEQVGTPFEVYNYPKTRFVASFIGQLNLIPVIVEDPQQGKVRFDNNVLQVEPLPHLNRGQVVTLALRPEEMNLGTVEGRNHLQGRVLDVMFLGAIVRVRVDLQGREVLADLFNERQLTLPRPGDQVIINFPPHACWVINEA
ncbi:MAG: ABC transporter ATP-binding protein [Thermanaerothrix sp.]|uniref:Spermidine/putrescine import ATP-binding protein PotA n=1 Tax=Thermanaerothrix solaris TaxID=3058434 RepID=A0ABU3NQ77_9CHLR|nr:ABC transporter ATP-binding protein [Thermanaerothrix sp. 4228-RoL]MDT8898978.1 ABC transporter ATP-binding protein [Thermanaerothrix sp. 4228-RoL]